MNPTRVVGGIAEKPVESVKVKVEEPGDSEFESDSDDPNGNLPLHQNARRPIMIIMGSMVQP